MTNTKDPKRAMDSSETSNSGSVPVTFSQVFGQQCQLMEAAVQSLHTLSDQISHFIVTKSTAVEENERAFLPNEGESLKKSMTLMRHLLADAQIKWDILHSQCSSPRFLNRKCRMGTISLGGLIDTPYLMKL